MSSSDPLKASGCCWAGPVTSEEAAVLGALSARLGRQAASEGLLDVAYRSLDTPLGTLLLAATPAGLVRVAFPTQDPGQVLDDLARRVSPRVLHAPGRLDVACTQIGEYFAGARQRFDLALDLQLTGGFRRCVLEHLRHLSYGTTFTYAQLAATAGRPKAVRAAASACATNPLPVVIACHRIIRSDGHLGGYLGGTTAKEALLDLESVHRRD